jgi:dihydroorotate dehydrogenase electron transfer subunit
MPAKKESVAVLTQKRRLSESYYELRFRREALPGGGDVRCEPEAGQFFMLKTEIWPVFLARPLGVARFEDETLSFLIEARGPGTEALCALESGGRARLIGPLGAGFAAALPRDAKKIALVAGGTGIAPLAYFAASYPKFKNGEAPPPDIYAGFKKSAEAPLGGTVLGELPGNAGRFIHVSEEGVTAAGVFPGAAAGERGRVADFVRVEEYDAVFCCGPPGLMRVIAERCAMAGVFCAVSIERKMACGVGACLGCTVKTAKGNRRVCVEGPVFNTAELCVDGVLTI